MEPFRPLVDLAAFRLADAGVDDVTPEAKTVLAAVLSADLQTSRGTTPLATCLERLAASLAQAYENGQPSLDLPSGMLPLDAARMGRI